MFILNLIRNYIGIKWDSFCCNVITTRLKGEFKIDDYRIYIDAYAMVPKRILREYRNINNYVQYKFDTEGKQWQLVKFIDVLYRAEKESYPMDSKKKKEAIKSLREFPLICITEIQNDTYFRLNKMVVLSKSDIRDNKIKQILNF